MIKNNLVVTCETEGANIGYKYLKRDLKPGLDGGPIQNLSIIQRVAIKFNLKPIELAIYQAKTIY